MDGLEQYLQEHGFSIAVGAILGIGLIVAIVILVAMGDRRKPPKDGP